VALSEIEVLSIGTTAKPFNIASHAESGAAQWNKGLIELMFESQMEADLAHAKLLLNGRLHRINVAAREGDFSLDDARPDKIQRLINLGRGEAVKKENLDIVRTLFLNGTLAHLFTPMHSCARKLNVG
jgi:hypothetical protein